MQQRAAGWTQTQAYDSPTIQHLLYGRRVVHFKLYKFKMLVCAGKSKKSKVILKVITF